MIVPYSLEDAANIILSLEEKVRTLQEAIDSYEALAEEEDSRIVDTIALIKHNKSQMDGEFALGDVSGQTKDYFMSHVDKYLKILNG